MLARKMFRDMKHNFGQFFSVFILAMLAMAMYVTFEGHVLSEENARKVFHKECNTADLWVYGESFSKEQLEDIRNLSFVEDAQLRTKLSGSAPDCDDAQVDIYLADENTVNKAYRISGEEFNPSDKDSVWLTDAFAQKRGIKVGDDFTVKYAGGTFTKKVKGFIESCEYEYRQADGDADVYIENIAFVYMSYDAIDIPVPHTEMDIVTKDAGALAHEEAVAEALNHKYSAIIDRKSVQGLARFDSELKQHESFSYVFALIFIGIAVLVIAISMSRMVEKQRTQIGTMNALGMKRSKILFHYISFSLITSGLGAVAGMLLGVFLGAPYMLDLFGAYYIVPGRKSEFNMIYLVILLAIVVICAFAAYVSCRKLLKIKPAEALRPAAPRAGKKCLAERLPFWRKLSFSAQYNLRDISRGKMRAFMSIAGTAFGMLLMVYGAGCNGLLAEMEAIVFDKTTLAQYQIKLAEDADADEVKKLASSLDGELIMTSALEVSAVKNVASSEKQKGVLTVTEGKKLYNILDLDNEVTDIEPGTVALSRKFADELNLKVGDTVYWHLYTRNEWHEAKIGVIYRSSETQGMTMLYDDYKNTHETYQPTMLMSDKTRDNLKSDAYVTSVNTKDQMREAYENSMEVVNMLVYMMMIFSATCVVVVLYNSGSLSFNERIKELATLKVLGFQSGAIRKMMSQQNVWFSVIGIILGAPFGRASFNMMMNSNGENFDYNLSIRPIAYLEAGIFVLVVSVLVSFMFSKRIKKLDMVEVLKGVE